MLQRLLLISAALSLFFVPQLRADDFGFGVDLDWANFEDVSDSDWGVGARFDYANTFGTFENHSIHFIPSFRYYFVDLGSVFDDPVGPDDFNEDALDVRLWTVNADVAYGYRFSNMEPYFGGGVGITRRTFDDVQDIFNDERTELGLNVLGGAKFMTESRVTPFFELRGTFYGDDGDDDEFGFDIADRVQFRDRFSVSGGILFGF